MSYLILLPRIKTTCGQVCYITADNIAARLRLSSKVDVVGLITESNRENDIDGFKYNPVHTSYRHKRCAPHPP